MNASRTELCVRLGIAALAAFTVAGCSIMEVADRSAEKTPAEATPPYKMLIKRALEGKTRFHDVVATPDYLSGKTILSETRTQFDEQMVRELTNLEVSAPEQELSNVGWAWKSCLRANYRQSQVKIAFFMKGDKIVDTRMNVAVDCADAKYEPLS